MTDPLLRLALDIKATFAGQFDAGIRVLTHLSKFCFENRNTFDETSARNTDVNQGRREVILEIRRLLNVKVDEQRPEKVEGKVI